MNAAWREIAQGILDRDAEELSDKELDFVRSMRLRTREPSFAQSKWLLEIERRGIERRSIDASWDMMP
jgi:hypothetical protein